ncbi:MAG: hypothetical protein JWO62_3306 [Acidimicrobiaceae bacterium]|nr:hypothetical protein [Acidimicrobiaceae bacterium]
MPTARQAASHLYRRAGFGASAAELDAAVAAGYEATVERLLAGLRQPDDARPALPHLSSYPKIQRGKGIDLYDESLRLVTWWLEKMATTSTPLREKLTLLLHGQFPTGNSKVYAPIFMFQQNETFRTLGPGAFNTLTQALAKDPAMMIWLDTASDVRESPNENFARELMERFTMGVGNYTQEDVRQAARAFTGWSITDRSGVFVMNEGAHDFGEKVVLGHSGDLTGEDVIEIVTHTPASARWVTARMWSWLAYPIAPSSPVVGEIAAGYASDLDMTNLLRAILTHPYFLSPASLEGLVKQPIEWVVGTMRAFRLSPASLKKVGGTGYLQYVLGNLGQIPFDPPSVGGWGQNEYWLSTASSLAQLNFAQAVVQVADLSPIGDEPVASRIDALADLLGIDGWTPQSRAALTRVRHLTPELTTLALTAPEYVVN